MVFEFDNGNLGPVSEVRGRLPGEHPLLGQPGLRLVKILASQGVAGRPERSTVLLRRLPYMTSANFSDFFIPLPLCQNSMYC